MNDLSKKLETLLSSKDISKIKEFAKSKQAQAFSKSLTKEQKDKIINEFLKMDTKTIQNKLKNANLDKLNSLSSEQIKNILG